jgi:phage gp29-like protein
MVQLYASLTAMIKNIRRDETEGLVLPYGYEFELTSTGGTRQFDTNSIIERYDTKISQTVLADFIQLGHQEVGSFALSSDKTNLFSMAICSYLDIICETFNNHGIPALIDINGDHFSGITDYPRMTHGDIEDADIASVAAFIRDMTSIGVLIPDDSLEDYVRQIGHLPERTSSMPPIDERRAWQQQQNQPPEPTTAAGSESAEEGDEIPGDKQKAARKRLGRDERNGVSD